MPILRLYFILYYTHSVYTYAHIIRLILYIYTPNHICTTIYIGNIRKAEHFIIFLKKVVIFLREYLKNGQNVEIKTPLAFLHQLQIKTSLERKPLRFTYTRLNSLLRTLEIVSLDEYNALQDVSSFITLLATYMEGFAIVLEPIGRRGIVCV